MPIASRAANSGGGKSVAIEPSHVIRKTCRDDHHVDSIIDLKYYYYYLLFIIIIIIIFLLLLLLYTHL